MRPLMDSLIYLEVNGASVGTILYSQCVLIVQLCIPVPTGITVQLADKPDIWHFRAHVIASSVDLPARAMVQKIMQFNGWHGCSFCQQPGQTVETRAGGHVHVYVLDDTNPEGPSREQETLMQHSTCSGGG